MKWNQKHDLVNKEIKKQRKNFPKEAILFTIKCKMLISVKDMVAV